MPWGRKALSFLALAATAGPACRDQRAPAPSGEGSPGERVFEPPARVVRAVPPHRIQAGSIGPYALGDELKDVLKTLPHGPRIELLQIEHLVSYRLVRVAQDTMLVGIGQKGRVSFIGVLDPEIAKTESGLGVGAKIDDLRSELGPERPSVGARDPRLVELERLPGARVLVEQDRVTAIVLGPAESASDDLAAADALSGGGPPGAMPRPPTARTTPPPPAAPGAAACTAASAREALADDPVAAIARVEGDATRVLYGCFTGSAPEAVVGGGDQLVLVVGEPGRLRRAASFAVPGLLFASAADTDGDGRDELIAVSEKRDSDLLAVRVEVLRGENGRLVGAGADEVYRVTSGAAASVGAKLKDIGLLIEASAGPEALEVTGFYLHEVEGVVRSVAPLLPRTVVLRPRRRGEGGAASSAGAGPPGRGGRPSSPERSSGQERD
ncbi:MAG TPA: hypothetical protein VK698_23535 [Kofleriaceae bacterium]|nr:hypothetical protein [Kofleriaceae bacterium]